MYQEFRRAGEAGKVNEGKVVMITGALYTDIKGVNGLEMLTKATRAIVGFNYHVFVIPT